MNRKFKYLEEKYGTAGAREKFEDVCFDILREDAPRKTRKIQPSPGDDGIDVLVEKGDKIDVYQCKYFLDKIDNSQKSQIKNSLKKLMSSTYKDKVDNWILCVPKVLTSKENEWWMNWSRAESASYSINIELMDEDELIAELKKKDLYNNVFNTVTLEKSDLSLIGDDKYINALKGVMGEVKNNDFRFTHVSVLTAINEIVENFECDPKFKNSSLIEDIGSLGMKIGNCAHDGFIRDEHALREIYKIRRKIMTEYEKMFF